MSNVPRRFWLMVERAFLFAGITLLCVYGAARLFSSISSSVALAGYEEANQSNSSSASDSEPKIAGGVDVSLWSEKRIRAYLTSLVTKKDPVQGILRIPRLRIEVPIFDGTDDLTLNRGVGRIIGTPPLGSSGNTGIAGHRDGFFRGLKDILVGDDIEIIADRKAFHYQVNGTQIVSPNDVSVLADRFVPSLTLVTCYPFYFVGDAPQRFIVSAQLQEVYGPAASGSASLNQSTLLEKKK